MLILTLILVFTYLVTAIMSNILNIVRYFDKKQNNRDLNYRPKRYKLEG